MIPSWHFFWSLVLKAYMLYNVFGSGAIHGIYAQFMTHASAMNNRKRISLLRGAGVRFATLLYLLRHLLHQNKALLDTIHSPYFVTPTHNAKTALTVQEIKSNQFWSTNYCLLRAMFSALRQLRYCDANKPAMDKIYYLCDRAHNALLRSSGHFDDLSLCVFQFWIIDSNAMDLSMSWHCQLPKN